MKDLNLEAAVKYTRENINRIIGAAVFLEQQTNLRGNAVIPDLVNSACRLLTQNINLAYLCCDGLYADSKETIDCGEVLDSVAEEAACILTAVKRDIGFKSGKIDGRVRIDAKAFIIVIMNLLQNALLYSPEKSLVKLTLESVGENAVITVGNIIKLSDTEPPGRSGLGLPLVKKITEWHSGVFELENDGSLFTARVKLPIIRVKSKSMLNSPRFDYGDYVSERFKPVNLFLSDIVSPDL